MKEKPARMICVDHYEIPAQTTHTMTYNVPKEQLWLLHIATLQVSKTGGAWTQISAYFRQKSDSSTNYTYLIKPATASAIYHVWPSGDTALDVLAHSPAILFPEAELKFTADASVNITQWHNGFVATKFNTVGLETLPRIERRGFWRFLT